MRRDAISPRDDKPLIADRMQPVPMGLLPSGRYATDLLPVCRHVIAAGGPTNFQGRRDDGVDIAPRDLARRS